MTSRSRHVIVALAFLALPALSTLGVLALRAQVAPPKMSDEANTDSHRVVTGVGLTPTGAQTPVGSFPANMVLSPDGKYILVTDAGLREYLTVLRTSDGSIASQVDFNENSEVLPRKKEALYFGLVCGPPESGVTPVYASRGAESMVSVLSLDSKGILTNTGKTLSADSPTSTHAFVAGLALSADGHRLFVADNSADPKREMRSSLRMVETQAVTPSATAVAPTVVDVPGYPYAVAAITAGPDAGQKVYVSSEQRGVVSVVNPQLGKTVTDIPTGTQPIGLTLDRAQTRLFVANAGSDTLSIVDTIHDKVMKTILLRPDMARGLPGATPTSVALAPDEKHAYVAMGDMAAVAVVNLPEGTLAGYIPVGWYPTSVVVSPDGARLFVANARGVVPRIPNDKPAPGIKTRPQYIQSIIEGTVSTVDLAKVGALAAPTAKVIANNTGRISGQKPPLNPGIKHVFYIIKENRTYDQVLGDVSEGNGDPAVVLFGKEVTPNLHALAERFVLLDNFYCCAEVSGDGWNWSTGGMASEYTSRNVPHSYGGRDRDYDFEGTNRGVPVDLKNIPDAAAPPGGYLWDMAAAHKVSLRDYGFFTDDEAAPRLLAEEGTKGLHNAPTKRTLVGHNDENFRQFDLTYADSDAWVKAKITPSPKQLKAFGDHADPSRFSAWKREFDAYVKNGNLPALNLVRFGRDHTSGTTAGASSARAMVADNDYAVGELVDAISHSPYWKSSAIVVVEDDAQNGYDHVDAHRSTAYFISPFIGKGSHDSRFYNTDSALRTIEWMLGLPAMTKFDAMAAPIADFGPTADNAAPFDAILPSPTILGEVNTRRAYRANDSARLLNPLKEESAPDEQLNDILWHAIKGRGVPAPPRHYSLSAPVLGDADGDGK